MYQIQATLKQLQFLYNWSTEVPEENENRVPERAEEKRG
jgi:hypothetical protein